MSPDETESAVGLRRTPCWWQWPTVLSLDAPAVAVLWQWEIAHATGQGLRAPRPFILGASVWLAYAADRWIEGWRLESDRIRTQRHHFYHRWRVPVAVMWVAVLAADLRLALSTLAQREIVAGFLLLGAVAAYLLSHQFVHRHRSWRAPKEVCVAVLLAGGAVLFSVAAPAAPIGIIAVPGALFAFLCFANCALISVWEGEVDQAHGQTSLALQYPRGAQFSRGMPWALAVLSILVLIVGGRSIRPAAACAACSAVLLGLVDRLEPRIGWRMARVLADVVVMTPVAHLLAVAACWAPPPT